jgi:tetratricopeptide (TPR) repeat protein
MSPQRHQDRGSRNTRKKPARRATHERVVKHPLYGDIPLLHVVSDRPSSEHWRYDPNYQPALPRGAVRGDVAKQVFCPMCHVPKYFYIDERRTCVQCGDLFTFEASEQKYWYERLKFNFYSLPIRCPSCRRARRSDRALNQQLATAKAALRDSPEDPAAHLAFARAIVEYHERTGHGRLEDAVASCRRAAKLWPQAPDASLWEGIAHARAGRTVRARECLMHFLNSDASKHKTWIAKAKDYLNKSSD